ncbi:MAG: hypothetical protein SOY73_17790 [Blautia sp.]|nr:hypothetical protein [Blautia sp.]MDY4000908.1 hypothetical protein [Blautia sp.]
MILQEYDEDLHIRNEKEISFQDGYEEGCKDTENKVLSEKQRADDEKQRADNEKKRADNINILNKILMLKLKGKSDEEIADTLHLPLETIHQVLDNI